MYNSSLTLFNGAGSAWFSHFSFTFLWPLLVWIHATPTRFGGALFIMHFCPHSGCFCSLPGLCRKAIRCSQTAVEAVARNAVFLCYFHPFFFFFFPSYESQKRCFFFFKRWWTNQSARSFLLWHGRAFPSCPGGGSRAGLLGCAAAGAGCALRAASTLGRAAAALWDGRGLLDLLCAGCCLTCCQTQSRRKKKGRTGNADINDGENEDDKRVKESYEMVSQRYWKTGSV